MVHYITIVGSDLEVLDNETPETLLNRDHLSLIQKLMNDYETKILILKDLKPLHEPWILYKLIGNKNVEKIIFKYDINFDTLLFIQRIIEKTCLCYISANNYSNLYNPTPEKLKMGLTHNVFLKNLIKKS